ncbi:MAG TPA: DMT family transporter [Candidatus Acidoferrum sp.]|nr:DMT family transporter [Candidatus Acidoferrum sp.]
MRRFKADENFRFIALVLLQTALWGVGNPLIKIAQRSVTPLWCLALRFILASVIFILFAHNKIKEGYDKAAHFSCLVISLCTAGAFLACNLSLIWTSATNAGFLMSLALVFTPFFAWPLLGQRARGKDLAAIAVVTAGMYFLCGGMLGFGLGEALALLGSALTSLAVVLTAKHLKTLGPITIAAMSTFVSAGFCLAAALLFEPLPKDIAPEGYAVVVYLAVFCTCIAWSIQNFALQKLSSALVSLLFCAEPLFTLLASRLLLGERLTAGGLAGGILIMAGLVYAARQNEETVEEKEKITII